MDETTTCKTCGKDAVYATTVHNSKGTFDVYYCEDDHETRIRVKERAPA